MYGENEGERLRKLERSGGGEGIPSMQTDSGICTMKWKNRRGRERTLKKEAAQAG